MKNKYHIMIGANVDIISAHQYNEQGMNLGWNLDDCAKEEPKGGVLIKK